MTDYFVHKLTILHIFHSYLHKGTSNGSTPELVEQSFTHGHIRNTGHTICDYDDT